MNRSILFAAIAGCASAPGWASASKPCSYTDLMPAYQAFATRTAALPPDQRALLDPDSGPAGKTCMRPFIGVGTQTTL